MKKVSIEIVIKKASIKDAILAEFEQFDKIKAERIEVINKTRKALYTAIGVLKDALNEEVGCNIWRNGRRYQYDNIDGKKYLVETLCFDSGYRNTTTPEFQFSIGYELSEEINSVSFSDSYYYLKNDSLVMFLRDDSESTLYIDRLQTYQISDTQEVHDLAMNGYRQWIKNNIKNK